jgi:hypothetical protein
MERFAEGERRAYINAREESLRRKEEASQRLLAARAMSKALNVIQHWEGAEDFERRRQWLAETKWIPPVIRAGGGPGPDRGARPPRGNPPFPSRSVNQRRQKKSSRCQYCKIYGHTGPWCDTPHYKCSTDSLGFCQVSPLHRNFQRAGFSLNEDCPYGGRQIKVDKGKERQFDADANDQDQGLTLYEDNDRD